MNIFFVYLFFCFFLILPFLFFMGTALLFLNKSKYAKKYLGYFVKSKLGLISLKNNNFSKEKIDSLVLLVVKVYNFLFVVIIGMILLFFVIGGISILVFYSK